MFIVKTVKILVLIKIIIILKDKTIHRKYWSSFSIDKFLTSAFIEKILCCKTYRMWENFGLQKWQEPMFLLDLFHIILETEFSLLLDEKEKVTSDEM